MSTIKYRGATVPVSVVKKVTSGKHKGMVEVKTKKALPHRRKGAIDFRHPNKVYR